MAKKRKVSGGPSQPRGPRELDPKDARLGPITTFKDVADSEDEYWENQDQDRILFNDGPKSKKQRRVEDEEAFLDPSDEEVLDYDQDSDDGEDDDVEDLASKAKKPSKKRAADSESEKGDDEEGDSGWWGSSRKDYYDADQIQTEADALEEEKEALRLQRKRLGKMNESDFIFDEDQWLAEKGPEDTEDDGVVTEVLKDVEISDDMSVEQRKRLLHSRYPELDFLAEEMLELQPLFQNLQRESEGQTRNSLAVVKYRILGCYVATLAMYFATLTAPARDANGSAKALDPAELRDHDVMGTLLECREAWQQVADLKPSKLSEAAASVPSPPEEAPTSVGDATEVQLKPSKKANKDAAGEKPKSKKAERQAKELEESLADLSSLVNTARKSKKNKPETVADDHSDFGEEEVLDSRTAAEKTARKRGLRFYTSQIVQKSNKRAGAGRDAGGDMDIPYRERYRDRQARLNAEAEKRGKKSSKNGAELGDDVDDEDENVASALRDDENEYYDMVANRTTQKKSEKTAKSEALVAAGKADRVVENETIGDDGKRKITYAIERNKGLAQKRSKLVRNPRVSQITSYTL
ncbi:hypothetical protein BJ170DRAFT_640626 [Xylariales sp. AK1849]|nr:hypothetical protein BJ170DRAFT_640626 [Xylariales sp. AK1849]